MLASQNYATRQCEWVWKVSSNPNQAELSQLPSHILDDFLRFVPVFYGRPGRGLGQQPNSLILCRVTVSLRDWHLNEGRTLTKRRIENGEILFVGESREIKRERRTQPTSSGAVITGMMSRIRILFRGIWKEANRRWKQKKITLAPLSK